MRVTLGLEQNDFKFNQKRIAEIKYLGELYNYKMIDCQEECMPGAGGSSRLASPAY
jgi:hypothetical protein